MLFLNKWLLVVFAVLLSVAAGRSAKLAVADRFYRSGSEGGVVRATRLEPNRALYHAGLGDLLSRSGRDARQAFRRAAGLKPDDAAIRTRLGLEAETAGDLDEAEDELLAAARASRKYLPRWTLANYYYRRGEAEQFWKWTREALAISHGDRTPAFQLCWNLAPDPVAVLERAIPDRRDVELDFASFLLRQGEWGAAQTIFAEHAAKAAGGGVQRFLSAIDQLIAVRRGDGALEIWNALCRAGAIPHSALDRASGALVSNEDFRLPALGAGFGWRVFRPDDVHVAAGRAGGLAFTFGGGQPERSELLAQHVPLVSGERHRLICRFRSQPDPFAPATPQSGLVWQVTDESGAALAESASFPAGDAAEVAIAFRAPSDVRFARMRLVHRRTQGSVRMRGRILLERATLILQDPVPAP